MTKVERSASSGDNLLAALDYSVLQQCIHCGLCLPSCPTYLETGRERNSPRGRIALMRAVADGELATTRAFGEEMSYCLGCLACTTACPAGVDYTHLLEQARAQVEAAGVLGSPQRNFARWLGLRLLFTHPRLLRATGRLLRFYQVSGAQRLVRRLGLTRLLPAALRRLEPATPVVGRRFSDALIRRRESPSGEIKHRVALLTGCVQDLVFAGINRDTADVLLANGCEVITPRAQFCCGSLHAHNGDLATARELARRQLDTINPAEFDAIISNSAGCGSHLKHYDRLLADDPVYAACARLWVGKLRDIHEWLAATGFRRPNLPAAAPQTVTYHDACHLCHGQGITRQPREILRAIPGLELRESQEATTCCGSAGLYTFTQPATADRLQQRKTSLLRATGAALVATANPGCILQIEQGFATAADRGNAPVRVVHPITLLASAYRAEQAP